MGFAGFIVPDRWCAKNNLRGDKSLAVRRDSVFKDPRSAAAAELNTPAELECSKETRLWKLHFKGPKCGWSPPQHSAPCISILSPCRQWKKNLKTSLSKELKAELWSQKTYFNVSTVLWTTKTSTGRHCIKKYFNTLYRNHKWKRK